MKTKIFILIITTASEVLPPRNKRLADQLYMTKFTARDMEFLKLMNVISETKQ